MSLLDKVVATEADAIRNLALIGAGLATSTGAVVTVQSWADWRTADLRNTVAALVPGSPTATVQADLAAAQVALNLAGSKALSAHDRYVAVKKAEAAIGTLALLVVG
jgi:hypothetical protein